MVATYESTLANGLRVVIAPDRTTPVVAVNVWYQVGSRSEPPGRTGFAHLFEHMMFQGSEHIARNGHFRHIETVGGSANATTWFDRTSYYETVPSHHLDLALWLEADRMGWLLPAMTSEKLENQRQVVMNERRERYDNQPYGDWDERVQSLLFPASHPYHHTVIGSMEDIESATLEDVHDFFEAHYRPGNAILTIAGDCEPEGALDRVRRYFGDIRAGPPSPPVPGEERIPLATGGTQRSDVQAVVPLPRVYMACRAPAFTTDAFYAGEAVSGCLSSGRSSRLYERLVRTGVAKSASCHLLPLTSGSAILLAVATGLEDADAAELEEALAAEIEGVRDLGEEELHRAVVGAETRNLRALQRAQWRAEMLSSYAAHFGSAARLNDDLRRLRKVTLDAARLWCEEYLHADNRVVVSYRPESGK